MGRKLPPIPRPTRDIPKNLVDILEPVREILQTRFFTGGVSNEKAVTRQELIDLGLVTQEQLTELDE